MPRRFVVLTLFPALIERVVEFSILGRAIRRGLVSVEAVDIRAFTDDRHKSTDDIPFGGGAGLVLKPEPIARAVESVGPVTRRVVLAPVGRRFEQADAVALAECESILLLCGRYEGIDERVIEATMDDALSIGDFVLTGGELAALVVIDAVARLLPGVLGNEDSATCESFATGLLEHPHYTRPATWRGQTVPPVLVSGHHARIAEWRRAQALERTWRFRPDLLTSARLTEADQQMLLALQRGEALKE